MYPTTKQDNEDLFALTRAIIRQEGIRTALG